MRDRTIAWNEDDHGFTDWVKLGHKWQKPVLQALLDGGLPARMPALEVRDHISQARQYRNQADIWVAHLRVEVKSLGTMFTNRWDWPYPTVRLDPVKKYRAKRPTPVAYVFISRETGGMVAIMCGQAQLDVTRGVRDPERGTVDDWITAPKDALVSMANLIYYLKADLPAGGLRELTVEDIDW